MFRICAVPLLLVAVIAQAAPHAANPERPRDGRQVLEFRELWHRGYEEDDIFFGALRTVEIGPDGNLYALDTQLSKAWVFSPTGEVLRTLSREGDGPGECRHPEDLVFLPDGSLGLAQYINGRIIRLALDGTPRSSIMPPGDAPGGSALSSIRRVRHRAGTLVINGVRMAPDPDGSMIRTQYLMLCDHDGAPRKELLASSVPNDLERAGWIEKDNYFPSHERWDVDARGRIVAAPERNDYRVCVYDREGAVVRSFGRVHEAPKRGEEEKQLLRDRFTAFRDGQPMRVHVEVEDRAASIIALRCMPDGETWVCPARAEKGRRDGVMMTWDVFDSTGVFVREADVICDGDPNEDRLVLLPGRRAALIRGAVQARRNTFGGGRGDEKEIAVHDLLLFAY